MPTQDTEPIKEKIMQTLRQKGPSLPIHIAGELKISPLFSSAFLSELISEKRISISKMKVGNSPLYFIPGQENMLERFANHLHNKEREAFLLLKEKEILKDTEQTPAIRVALRSIRDFAIPFKKGEDIYWRYFTVPETKENLIKQSAEKKLDIFNEEESAKTKLTKKQEKPKKPTKRKPRKKPTKRKGDIFFNKVKEFLSKKEIKIMEVESLGRNELILKVQIKEKEYLLFAYNKKRIDENNIVKAGKKAEDIGLPYVLLSKGGPLKRTEKLIRALKKLNSIETLK